MRVAEAPVKPNVEIPYRSDWTLLSPLPDVHARYRDEHSFRILRNRYEKLPKEPLLIRGELFEPVVPAEPRGALHLDSLLGTSVLNAHPRAPYFGKSGFPVVVPLPLELEWVSEDGKPLWVCSELRGQGDMMRAPFYWHKRYPEDRAHLSKKVSAKTRAGRWKEYRIPMSGVDVPEIRAACIGNAEEVARLLSFITHVGKKIGYGFGRVEWTVDVLDADEEMIREVCMNVRPVPAKYLMEAEGELSMSEGSGWSRRSFSPPHWYAPWWDLAVVRG